MTQRPARKRSYRKASAISMPMYPPPTINTFVGCFSSRYCLRAKLSAIHLRGKTPERSIPANPLALYLLDSPVRQRLPVFHLAADEKGSPQMLKFGKRSAQSNVT